MDACYGNLPDTVRARDIVPALLFINNARVHGLGVKVGAHYDA